MLVGNTFDDINGTVPLENSTGVQAETARGWISGYNAENPLIGIKSFSNTNYWSSTINSYPAYVYNENSQSYENIENYKSYLEGLGTKINEARLITIEELEELGCSTTTNICDSSVNWIYTTTYWTGTASSSSGMWRIRSDGILGRNTYTNKDSGIRPVIVIDRSLI